MTTLTRKIWVGIGAATIVGAAVAGDAAPADAQDKGHKAAPPAAEKGAATSTPAQGGEAYLTDDGPKDTRVRFYRDIALMRGHLRIGGELIEEGRWDDAIPHFAHPVEEIYGKMERYMKRHDVKPFDAPLKAIAQAVTTKRMGAYRQSAKAVDAGLERALDTVKKYMSPVRSFTIRAVIEVLKVARSEYEAAIQDGKFVNPVEYQDSRGFVWHAEQMFEGAAGELERIDKVRLSEIRRLFAELKTAWPAPMPPAVPVLDLTAVEARIARIEELSSGYR